MTPEDNFKFINFISVAWNPSLAENNGFIDAILAMCGQWRCLAARRDAVKAELVWCTSSLNVKSILRLLAGYKVQIQIGIGI